MLLILHFDPSKFTMKDDCGGISIDDARQHVFRFGEPVKEKTRTGLGACAIRMKRAFFKIGKQICIVSRTIDEAFGVDIDVDAWMGNDVWDFPFKYAQKEKSKYRCHSNRNLQAPPRGERAVGLKGL